MTSFRFKISPRRKQFTRLITTIHELLEEAYWFEHQKAGLTKVKLAERLGVHKSFVSRVFGGTSNMTLETLSNFAYEMGREVEISLPPRAGKARWINYHKSISVSGSGNALEVTTQSSGSKIKYISAGI